MVDYVRDGGLNPCPSVMHKGQLETRPMTFITHTTHSDIYAILSNSLLRKLAGECRWRCAELD